MAEHGSLSEGILVVGPAWVGDMVMAQSLLATLHERFPHRRIDVLAPAWSLPLLERMPEVARAIAQPLGHGRLGLQQRWQQGRALRDAGYQQAFVLPNSWKSALLPWAAAIPQRTGWRGEWRYGLLNDLRKLDPDRYPRMIDRFHALAFAPGEALPTAPVPRLRVRREQALATAVQLHLPLDRPVLAVCPGAEFGPSKQWPARHHARVLAQMIDRGWQAWILGSAADQGIADDITQRLRPEQQTHVHRLTGRTRLEQAVDLLILPRAVLSNDSGLMHVAAAVDPQRLLIALYGSTSPLFTPPLAPASRVLRFAVDCSPCFARDCPLGHHDCMEKLAPEQVLEALACVCY